MKKIIFLLLTSIMVVSLVSCGSNGETSASDNTTEGSNVTGTITLQAGHVLTEDSPYHLALLKWSEEVYEKTEGRIQIDVFANSTLGNEREMIEALTMGTLDITLPNSAPLANFTDAFRVFDLPFLFMNREDAYAVCDSEIGENMLSSLEDQGIIGLSMWENGFRYIANSTKEVYTPADLAGMKIRTMENDIHMASFRAWGADATSMAWGEVYTAVQQRTVDGLENPITPIYQNALHEVAPYITMTGHFYCPAPLLIAQSTWDTLSEEDQQILKETAEELKAYERDLCLEYDNNYITAMEEEGATVVGEDEIDKQVWRDTAQSVYDEYTSVIGEDLLAQIQEMIA